MRLRQVRQNGKQRQQRESTHGLTRRRRGGIRRLPEFGGGGKLNYGLASDNRCPQRGQRPRTIRDQDRRGQRQEEDEVHTNTPTLVCYVCTPSRNVNFDLLCC